MGVVEVGVLAVGDAAFRPSQSLPAALHKGTRGPAGISGVPHVGGRGTRVEPSAGRVSGRCWRCW